MKEPFWWNNNGQWIPIYSLEKFIYFCNLDPQKALQCLQDMWIEYWFYQNGESFLGQKVESIRTDGDVAVNDKVPRLIEELSPFGHSKKFFKLLNIDKAIEITLKEYETLRAEILQNQSELSQLILLGLAAIFTIASLGLAPLADFLTVENTIIEMPLQLEKISDIFKQKQAFISIDNVNYKIDNEHEKQQLTVIETPPIKLREVLEKIDSNTNKKTIEETLVEIKEIINQEYIDNGLEPNKFDIETAEVLIRGKSKNPKYFLKITRAIDGETIEKQGIVPSIVILNWLIPGLSLYLIYRSLFSIQKNKMIGIYIYYRVEKRLIELSKDKAEYLWYITPDTMRKSYLTNMGW
nr:hypothetical protein [Crocosphaera sp.]